MVSGARRPAATPESALTPRLTASAGRCRPLWLASYRPRVLIRRLDVLPPPRRPPLSARSSHDRLPTSGTAHPGPPRSPGVRPAGSTPSRRRHRPLGPGPPAPDPPLSSRRPPKRVGPLTFTHTRKLEVGESGGWDPPAPAQRNQGARSGGWDPPARDGTRWGWKKLEKVALGQGRPGSDQRWCSRIICQSSSRHLGQNATRSGSTLGMKSGDDRPHIASVSDPGLRKWTYPPPALCFGMRNTSCCSFTIRLSARWPAESWQTPHQGAAHRHTRSVPTRPRGGDVRAYAGGWVPLGLGKIGEGGAWPGAPGYCQKKTARTLLGLGTPRTAVIRNWSWKHRPEGRVTATAPV